MGHCRPGEQWIRGSKHLSLRRAQYAETGFAWPDENSNRQPAHRPLVKVAAQTQTNGTDRYLYLLQFGLC